MGTEQWNSEGWSIRDTRAEKPEATLVLTQHPQSSLELVQPFCKPLITHTHTHINVYLHTPKELKTTPRDKDVKGMIKHMKSHKQTDNLAPLFEGYIHYQAEKKKKRQFPCKRNEENTASTVSCRTFLG